MSPEVTLVLACLAAAGVLLMTAGLLGTLRKPDAQGQREPAEGGGDDALDREPVRGYHREGARILYLGRPVYRAASAEAAHAFMVHLREQQEHER